MTRSKRTQNLFEALGLSRLPSNARIYLVLVFTFAGLAILSALPFFSGQLAAVSIEGLKMVLAALLGALSQLGDSRQPRDGRIAGDGDR